MKKELIHLRHQQTGSMPRIVVEDTQIKVYVNNASTPSLTVDKLNTRKSGLIGLSNEGLEGDFANLTITK